MGLGPAAGRAGASAALCGACAGRRAAAHDLARAGRATCRRPTSDDAARREKRRENARRTSARPGSFALGSMLTQCQSTAQHTHAQVRSRSADRRSDTTQEACSQNVRGRARLACGCGTSHARAVPALAGCARLFSDQVRVVAAGAGAAFLVHANQLLSACGCTWRPCRRAPRPRRQPV